MTSSIREQFERALWFHSRNRLTEAGEGYRRVLKLQPLHAEALHHLGVIYAQSNRAEEAIRLIKQALALQPGNAEAHLHLGNAFYGLKMFEEACQSFRRARELKPLLAQASINLGMALYEIGQPAESLEACDRALTMQPDNPDVHYNRANALKELGLIAEAIAEYDTALRLRPGFRQALHNQANCLLLQGNFARGLRQLEYRGVTIRSFPNSSQWTGEQDLAGKTLFIHHEFFLGDVIQLSRYARLASQRGARVLLSAPTSLHPLLSTLEGVEIIAENGVPARFDYHLPLMSLPLAFGTTVDTIPGDTRYLRADAGRVARWRERLGSAGFRVGIAWQGSALSVKEGRSIPLDFFRPLTSIGGVRLISLQVGPGSEQLSQLEPPCTIETLGADFDAQGGAFMDTAAVMENLDLVITCDSAIAHLAGVLDRPVWVALKLAPDWRYLLNRSDTPWYPSMLLFRQTRPGDWTDVFRDIQSNLAKQVGRVS